MIQAFNYSMKPWNDLPDYETSYSSDQWERSFMRAGKPYSSDVKEYFILRNLKSGRVYNVFDSSIVVAIKCAFVFFATPLYIGLRIATHLVLFVVYDLPVEIIFHHIQSVFIDLNKNKFTVSECIAKHRSECCMEIPLKLLERITSIFQSIYYLPGMMLAALGGALIDPYQGRYHISLIERDLNSDARWNTDIRVYCAKPEMRNKSSFFKTSFFLMHSFQPRYTEKNPLDEPSYKNVTYIPAS